MGTQHPVDMDYRALSNVDTWMVGPLRERDKKRDMPDFALPNGHRQFRLVRRDGSQALFESRDCETKLVGPRGVEDFEQPAAPVVKPKGDPLIDALWSFCFKN